MTNSGRLALLTVGAALLWPGGGHPVHVGVTTARTCPTGTAVTYSYEQASGSTWRHADDDGAFRVEFAASTDGPWLPADTRSGGEHTLRAPTLPAGSVVRVVRTSGRPWTSTAAVVTDC